MRLHCIGLLLFLLIALKSVSQESPTQTIRGTIVDAGNEAPVYGATVIIPGTDPLRGTISGEDGSFRMTEIPVGRISIRVSCVGYQTQDISGLLLTAGKEMVVMIRLTEQLYDLGTVEIRDEKDKSQTINEMAIVSARSFTTEESERYAGSFGDPARMASNFAGISTSSDQRNDIVIRGNSPTGLLWRIEGVDIPNPNHFSSFGSTGGAISMLNSNTLTRSDFYSGAFPAEFGNALSGVFDLRLRNGNNETHEFMAQVGINGFEAGAEGPVSKDGASSFLINIRYGNMKVFHLFGMNFGTGEAVPDYKDITFKFNTPTKKAGRFTVFGIGGRSYIELLNSQGDSAGYGLQGSDLRFGSTMGLAGLSHTYFFSNKWRIHTIIAGTTSGTSTKKHDLKWSATKPAFLEYATERKGSFSMTLTYKMSKTDLLHFGSVLEKYYINYKGNQYDTIRNAYFSFIQAQGKPSIAKLFADWQHRFSDRMTLNSGLFGMYYFLNDSRTLEPRLAFRWQISETGSISAGLGMHSQTQLKAVHYICYLADTASLEYEYSNKDLGMTRAVHAVVGYDQNFGSNTRIKTELYYQKIYNVPVAAQQPEFSFLNMGSDYDYISYRDMMNQGSGENYGIEITLEKFLSKGFYYLFTGSLFNSLYCGQDGIPRNTRYNNNFVFNFLCGYETQLSRNWTGLIDLKTVYAGGMRYIPIDPVASAAAGKAVYQWDEAYRHSYPDYFRINLKMGCRYNGKKTNQEIAFDLQNLTDQQNVFLQTWNNSTQSIMTTYQMGFLPVAVYKIFF